MTLDRPSALGLGNNTLAAAGLVLELPPEALEVIVEAVTDRVTAALPPAEEGWPEWMSVPTAARYLDRSAGSVRKLYERGRVPSYSEGSGCRVFLRRSDLDEFMDATRS